MKFRLLTSLVLLSALPSVAVSQAARDSASDRLKRELRQRADSIEHLDASRELASAIKQDDRRFIGVQGYARTAPGVSVDDSLYPKQKAMHIIEGTSDGIWAPEVARLNQVAADYAFRYNRLLLKELRSSARKSSRPAT
jgi:hypothetical protein